MISGVPCGRVEGSGALRDVVPPVEIDSRGRPSASDPESTANDVDMDDRRSSISPPRPQKRSPFANGPPSGAFPAFARDFRTNVPAGPSNASPPRHLPLSPSVLDMDARKSLLVRFWRNHPGDDKGCEQCRNIPKWLKVVFGSRRKARRLVAGTFLTYRSSLRKSSKLSSILATHGSASTRLSAQLSAVMNSETESVGVSANKSTWRAKVKFTLRNLVTTKKNRA